MKAIASAGWQHGGAPLRGVGNAGTSVGTGASGAFEGYVARGFGYAAGQQPWAKSAAGAVVYDFMGVPVTAGFTPARTLEKELVSNGLKAIKPLGPYAKAFHVAMGPGMLGLSAYLGYQDNGLSGAFEYVAWDVSTHASVFAHALKPGIQGAANGSLINPIGLTSIPRFIGAGIGSSVGYQVAGYPGMFLGGYIGGSYKGMAVAGGLAAAAGAAYAVGSLYTEGGNFRRRQRMLETSGDTSAFMTSGATTMRSRAVSAIQKSHTNARSALGNEAGFMHMPSKNYHSKYKGGY
jgi:hypothetical protein